MKSIFIISALVSILAQPVHSACQNSQYKLSPLQKSPPISMVKDTRSKLNWHRCLIGQTGSFCSGSAKMVNFAEAQEELVKYPGWRLPTHDELLTLAQPDCKGTAINGLIFPGNNNTGVWTATRAADANTGIWTVNFATGYDERVDRTSQKAIRLVQSEGYGQ